MTETTRRFLRGVGSVLDLSPVGRRVERAPRLSNRRRPDPTGYVFAPPGAEYGENQSLAAVIALAEFFVQHPEVAEREPATIAKLLTMLDAAQQTPPIVYDYSKVGNLWVDAVKLAEDRYRVRQRLVAEARKLLGQVSARG